MEESPLHPFELHNYIPINIGGLDISINKAVIMMWVVVGIVLFLMLKASSARQLVPGKLQNAAEIFVDFIRGIILDTMGQQGMRFFPLIATLFLFILFCNIVGLIPGSYTVTSQLIVTAVFAVAIYGLSIVVGFVHHGVKFLGILVPPGTPGWLLPLIIPIELISQLARPISLAVRLFANMTAGHVILGVLFSMGIGLLQSESLWLKPIAVAPLGFTVFMNILETGIACIQAYIFTVLSCVYLGDAVTLHGHEEHAH
ncbi:MAG TPA: F0F1 ATP synthase subunit A [Nitrospira sp.]|nr:F0F1 ATP synthase subunit A [Nitrospira sp.]